MFSLPEWMRKTQASRKYVDLIMEASSKWANWDPPNKIEAGDFGMIDKASGRFEKTGNIYTHPSTADLASRYPVQSRPAEEVYHINSVYAKKVEGKAGVEAGSSVKFATDIKFNKRRGAFLVMHNTRMAVVPDEFFKDDSTLSCDVLAKEKKVAVVAQTFTCDGYVLYLSSKQQESVSVVLKASAASVPAGGAVGGGWATEGGSGVLRKGYDNTVGFTPLYLLKSVQPPPPRRRETPDPNEHDGDRWNEVEVPWDFLDSDGEEEPPEEFSDAFSHRYNPCLPI